MRHKWRHCRRPPRAPLMRIAHEEHVRLEAPRATARAQPRSAPVHVARAAPDPTPRPRALGTCSAVNSGRSTGAAASDLPASPAEFTDQPATVPSTLPAAKKVLDALGIPEGNRRWPDWKDAGLMDAIPRGAPITPPEVLFQKIEDTQVAEWTERFGGGKE